MLRMMRIIAADFFGLVRVCGLAVALRWLMAIAMNFKKCVRARNLQPADIAMGIGPFAARLGQARAKVFGEQAISGIREIWVRDVYLNRERLSIPPTGTVVDLGANMGNFTVLALSHGAGVRCVSVEGDPRMVEKLQKNIEANGWQSRCAICTKFIGETTEVQRQLQNETGGEHEDRFISEAEFVRQYDLERIDFLKCDIEGSEFGLLRPGSLLLGMARQLAVELHAWGGDVKQFIAMLRDEGFDVDVASEQADGAIVQAKRIGQRRAPVGPQAGVSHAVA